MADICDNGNETSELFLKEALSNKKDNGPEYTGTCYNCEEPLERPRRFCDKDCMDDWHRRELNKLGVE